ncbi:MAG: HEAT repeat domain-containing protein, partial [bacterium]
VRKESIEGLSRLSPTPRLIASLVPLMDPGKELTLRNSIVEVLERFGHEAAPMLVEHLRIDQADVRKFLVDILGNIAHPGTVPAMMELLSDPEDNIRAAAAEALAAMGDPSACGGLLEAIDGADDWVTYSILGSLAQLQCRQALPVFFRYLGSQLLSRPAFSGIGTMGSIADGLKLMEMLPTLSKGAVKSAFLAAGSIYRRHAFAEERDRTRGLRDAVSAASDEGVVQSLLSQLEVTDDLDSRKDIIATLGMVGTKQPLEAILVFVEDDALSRDLDLALMTIGRRNIDMISALLRHHDPLVRQRGIRALQNLKSKESLGDLLGMLADESGHVRKDAAAAVASLGDADSIERLLPLLEDEYSDVAHSAAQALVQLGRRWPKRIAARIHPMLEDAPPALYMLLILILAEVGGPDWEDLCLKAAQSTEPEVRAAAVSCLRRSGSNAAMATIINALADENPQVRVQAAVTLEDLKHPEALEPLRSAIYDQDPWVRSAAASALSHQPGADPDDFKDLLTGEDLMMQTSALEALGQMAASGSEGALDKLARQFEAGALEMRRSICRLLAGVGGAKAFDLLLKALKDADPGIRTFAVHALAQRPEDQVRKILDPVGENDPDKQVREAVRSVLEGRK